MDSYPAFSDLELWQLAGAEPDAFGEIFRRHARSVHAVCFWRTGNAATAEDLTSIVFIEAWRQRTTVILTGTTVLPWLLGIANNAARNADRKARRHRLALARLPKNESSQFEDREIDRLDAELSMSLVQKVLDELPERERDIVILVFWSGLTYEETAAVLHVPVGTIRSRVSRTRAKLQHSLISLPILEKESQ